MSNRRNLVSRWSALASFLLLGIVASAPAFPAADLTITSMSLIGSARVGNCNKISMTVRNNGDEFTGNATLDIALFTFPSATPNQNRAEKTLFISPMQGGGQTSFVIDQVQFLAAGQMTAQALVDSTQETAESNENNNSRTLSVNVSGSCTAPPPPTPSAGSNPAGCDVAASFTSPSGATVPGGQAFTYNITFENEGTTACNPFKVKISRYNNKTCSGYGSQVGGSRAWAAVGGLAPNASQTASISESRTPNGSAACLKLDYSPHSFNDDDPKNHRIQKLVTYQ